MKKQILGIIAIMALVGCGKEKEILPTDLDIRPVTYVKVLNTNPETMREFSGTIIPSVISKLSFRVSGTVVERNVNLGSQVEVGDILAVLDDSDYKIKYEEILANYKAVESNVLNSQSIFNRDKELFLENSISKAQYDQSRANYMAGRSQLQAAEQNLDYAKSQLEYTKLVSPGNGTIAQVEVQINETVNGGTPVVTLSESGDMQVLFNVSDVIINRLYEGQEVELDIINSDIVLNAEISNIGVVSNSYGNTYPVKAKILTSDPQLKPGMTATVKVNFQNEDAGKIYLPINAVQLDKESKHYVMIVEKIDNEIGSAKKKIVEIGNVTNNGLEIKSGILEGDYVITSGAAILVEGQSVKLGVEGAK